MKGSLLSLDLRSHQNILLDILMLSDRIVVSNKVKD